MNYNLNDEVWFKDQDRKEEPCTIVNMFLCGHTWDLIIIALDCNNCYVIGRDDEFTKANTEGDKR